MNTRDKTLYPNFIYQLRAQIVILISLTLLAVFIAYLYQQSLPLCDDAASEKFSKPWWTCPREVNQHVRIVGNLGDADLADVKFSSDNSRGWVLTKRGEVSETLDGGTSWRKLGEVRDLSVSPGVLFTELIASEDSSKLWVIAEPEPWSRGYRDAVIFGSTNGGRTWTLQEKSITPLPDTSSGKQFFVDQHRKTWLTDRYSATLISANSGSHWLVVDQSGVEKEEFLFGITFDSAKKNGWALGEDFVLKTTDGGQHWQRIEDIPSKIKDRKFIEKEHGEQLNAFRTFHVDQTGRHIWIAGLASTVFHSADAGETWSQQVLTSLPNITHISFSQDNLHGWVISSMLFHNSFVLETRDGGKTWKEKQFPISNKHNGLFIADDQRHLWLPGNQGTLLHSRDGGTNWQLQASHLTPNIFDIDVNDRTGEAWLLGNKGIWHSRDKGETWNVALSDDAADFFLPSFIRFDQTGQRGIVLGTWYQHDEYLARTTDGGRTWTRITPEVLQKNSSSDTRRDEYRADGFVMSKDGKEILVYNASRDFLSRDYGETWQELNTNPADEKQLTLQKQASSCSRIYGVETISRDVGATREQREWATNAFCQLPHNTQAEIGLRQVSSVLKLGDLDALKNVSNVDGADSKGVNYPAIWFDFTEDGKYGVAASNRKGKIIASKDSGEHWREYTVPTTSRLYTVRYSSDEKQAWAVGEQSAIFMSEDNGKSWQAKGQYQRLPPPWFYALGLSLGLMWLVLMIYKIRKHTSIKREQN